MLFCHKMQSKADKQLAEAIIEQCWSEYPLQEVLCSHLKCPQKATVALTSERVGIGWWGLSRAKQISSLPPGASWQANYDVAVFGMELASSSSSVPALEWVATACKIACLATVVSPDERCATHMVRELPSVCSEPLVEILMSNISDISDLLGGFEYTDFSRKLRSATCQVQHVAMLMLKDMWSYTDSSTDSQVHTWKLL